MAYEKLIFELSQSGRKAYALPPLDVPKEENLLPEMFLRKKKATLPQVSELDVVRHYTLLSKKNYSVDSGFYPLGSCTMKYNPKINEDIAANPKFARVHPYQPEHTVQGALEVMDKLGKALCEITGMDDISLQPAAGAHGELAGLMLIKQYHKVRGDLKRTKIIVPDSAHGTNPASVAVAGFDVVQIPSQKDGTIHPDEVKKVLGDDIAGLMLTNPNTLGIFETHIREIADLVHDAGGLLYYDGANLNAIMGISRPGDMGFDVMHTNLHKTFSTPHGGGGPGSGPVICKKILAPYLPVPFVEQSGDAYRLSWDKPDSIGKVKNFYGNFGVMLRAYTYILTMGADGLKAASQNAVLNANYLKSSLKGPYKIATEGFCMHEAIFAGIADKESGVVTLDIAKRLIDYGYHPPTIYFPLIVDQALMAEPTETESKATIDGYVDAMLKIAEEAKENPQLLKEAPHNAPISRVDEARAVKEPIFRWKEGNYE